MFTHICAIFVISFVQVQFWQVPARQWSCPHHSCFKCGKKSHECSNCLFRLYTLYISKHVFNYFFSRRCENCPLAFCQDCKPVSHQTLHWQAPSLECDAAPPDDETARVRRVFWHLRVLLGLIFFVHRRDVLRFFAARYLHGMQHEPPRLQRFTRHAAQ